ncbi:hypothetical protein SUGI_0116820 [Cryptomeria japonica]|uniref:BURP domain-containing protein 16 n=1 Tax=Cryptomeria japonica TaxID=3369 RepID=UPI002408B6F4|nr:BURP domain-containing protein 16 [Cryptomeria japonica]GLJ09843.1 hypothetical protein SUGI_0116820 [Cryptomeria japonica]
MATRSRVLQFLVVGASVIFGLGKVSAVNSSVAELVRERWQEKLPDIGIPAALVNRLSPLSLRQLKDFTTALKNRDRDDTSFDASHFCRSADLLCREPVLYINGCLRYGRSQRMLEEIEEHAFFDKEELRESGEMILPEMGSHRTLTPFLPSELAEMMPPFSTANVSQILKLLNIPSDSNMSRSMVSTLKKCEDRADEGEVQRCSTSVEGMVEFVVSLLGSDVDLLNDPSVIGFGQRATVTKAAKRENIVGGKSPVTCHNFVFPYGVSYCHSINGSEVFDLQLEVMQDDKQVVRNATALCHYFSDGVGGTQASCHFVYGEMLLWMPKPSY